MEEEEERSDDDDDRDVYERGRKRRKGASGPYKTILGLG